MEIKLVFKTKVKNNLPGGVLLAQLSGQVPEHALGYLTLTSSRFNKTP